MPVWLAVEATFSWLARLADARVSDIRSDKENGGGVPHLEEIAVKLPKLTMR
jgi:hypothetical protein